MSFTDVRGFGRDRFPKVRSAHRAGFGGLLAACARRSLLPGRFGL
jgi:hypothetical protein